MATSKETPKQTTREFIGLEAAGTQHWNLRVQPQLLGGGRGSLFGGVGLAIGVLALEEISGMPPVWATAHFLTVCGTGDDVTVEATVPAAARTVTHGRVVATHEGREIFSVSGCAGRRADVVAGTWETMPDVPDPETSAVIERQFEVPCVHDHIEARVARGMFGFSGAGTPSGDNKNALWVRFHSVALDHAQLALLADYGASALGNAVGHIVYCTSLDNTIRFAAPPLPDTEWVLCENRVEQAGAGFATTTTNMWDQQGRLLAVASQSVALLPSS